MSFLKETTLYHLIRALRPRQWVKNASLFAPAIFSGFLWEEDVFKKVVLASVLFSFLSSSTYLINDVVDAKKDALHPIKKNRPIASGKLSVLTACLVATLLVALCFYFGFTKINAPFFFLCFLYFIMQILYSFFLRNIIIIDALTVSLGFIFRVFAGGFAGRLSISSWIILATIGLSLLLAFGKRRSERTILSDKSLSYKTRETLKSYPDSLLDSMISMSATFTIISYAIFSFQSSYREAFLGFSRFLPNTLASPKWMMLTIPVVIYGVARYLFVIYEKKEAESPERVLLSDKPLLSSVILWVFFVMSIIYL